MPAPDIDKAVFDKNLLLTQAYCELQLAKPFTNNAMVLRSFNPEYKGRSIFSFGKGQYNNGYCWNETVWSINPFGTKYTYEQLFEKQMLNKQPLEKIETEAMYKGRILVADIDQTVLDGASEANSDGFISIYDCPPIDTWFYLVTIEGNRVLFAWIPEQFEEVVQVAIDVNCMDCLGWYDDGEYFKNRNVYIPQPRVHINPLKPKSILTRLIDLFIGTS